MFQSDKNPLVFLVTVSASSILVLRAMLSHRYQKRVPLPPDKPEYIRSPCPSYLLLEITYKQFVKNYPRRFHLFSHPHGADLNDYLPSEPDKLRDQFLDCTRGKVGHRGSLRNWYEVTIVPLVV